MYCTNCGAELSKKICSNCGVKQEKTHKYCKWCGAELAENASVCVQCNKKVKENKFAKFILTAVEIVASLLFAIVFIASFTYFSQGVIAGGILLLIFGILGLIIALPFMRKIYEKKLKEKIVKPLRIGGIVVLMVIIYGFVYPFANNQVANIEKQKQYDAAVAIMESDPLSAKKDFLSLADFEDSSEKAEEANEHIYNKLEEKLEADFVAEEELSEAEEYVDALPEDFDDSRDLLKEFKYKKGKWMIENHFYAMARHLYKDMQDYKDVKELLQAPVFGLIGNIYTFSSTLSYGYENYHKVFSLSFNDSINQSFYATYRISTSTTSNILAGDFSDPNATKLDYLCYVEDGKIFVGKEELTPLTTEDGKITSFRYGEFIYTIASDD